MGIRLDSLLPPCGYRPQRNVRRAQAIAHRRGRCLNLGPVMRLQFEDEISVRHQIQEVLRADRIVDAQQVQHTIDSYAHLLPDGRQWKATLFIELASAAQRERELALISQAAHHVYLGCGAMVRVVAEANEDLADRHRGRPSGVHFLRFQLPDAMRAALLAGQTAALGCAHPAYAWQRAIPPATLRRLCLDFSDAAQRDETCRGVANDPTPTHGGAELRR